MALKISQKVTRTFEDETSKIVWTYDYAVSKSNPLFVEINYKNENTIVKNTKKKSK